MARIDQLIEIISKADATDLHIVAGSVPVIRVEGRLEKTRHRHLTKNGSDSRRHPDGLRCGNAASG